MIFDAVFNRARERQQALAAKLRHLWEARAKVSSLIDEYSRYLAAIEARLALAREDGDRQPFLVTYPRTRFRQEWMSEADLAPDDHGLIQRVREGWSRLIDRLISTREKLDRKIKEFEERLTRLGLWLLEKEETWGKIDPEKLRGQVRDILEAAEELSQLVVGRNIPIAFDTREGAALGHVPIEKEKKGRKVYLSTKPLEEQPEHLLDYYRALMVHELGHILLHVKDSGKDYRRLRRLVRAKVSLAPDFFRVFNILLDEQLERVLRDTKPEWQRWFNRLDFWTRRIPLDDLKDLLRRGGRPDADAALADLVARRLVKLYSDPRRPFATIQSAAIISEGLPFTRLYAFYAVLRNRLPLATIGEPWLKECLACIPKDFKLLDVFEVHALAVEIYKILMGDASALRLVTIQVRRSGSDEPKAIQVPGIWLPGCEGEARKTHELSPGRKSRRQRPVDVRLTRRSPSTPQPDPEGGPPAPPPPLPEPPSLPAPRPQWSGRSSGCSRKRGRGRGRSMTPWAEADRARAAKATPRPTKARPSRRQASRAARKLRKAQERAAKQTGPQRAPDPPRSTPAQRPTAVPQGPGAALEDADRLASAPTPAMSTRGALQGLARALDHVLKEIRAEKASSRREPPAVERIIPDAGRPADQRNEADVRQFPAPEKVLRLVPNRRQNLVLTRAIKRFVPLLRPYLAVADPEKVVQERLTLQRYAS